MNIKVLMITFNRPTYTEKSLKVLCDTAPKNLKVTIWDNGSDSETKEVVRKYENHWCVEKVIFNEKNDKLRHPTNWFWKNNRDADLLGKVDDDCLVPENWCQILGQAHKDIPEAGVLGCWPFLPEDFDQAKAQKKIMTYGSHQLLRNCWVGGSGYLIKREVIEKICLIDYNESFTGFCIRAAAKGFINGWYYPFLYQEHMDDPRVSNTGICTEDDFQKTIPLTARTFSVNTRNDWIKNIMKDAQRQQQCSINPSDYIGLTAKMKRKLYRLFGANYFPKMK